MTKSGWFYCGLRGRLLLMTGLDRESQVTKPAALEELAPKAEPGPEERELARKLIEASSTELDFSKYRGTGSPAGWGSNGCRPD